MRKLIEFIFEKLPGDDSDFSFIQKFWVVFISVGITTIILYKTISYFIKNF